MPETDRDALAAVLETVYRRYNRREYVSPDPLQFLYDFPHPAERELVGLLASSLAYGRVAGILASVSSALERMEGRPLAFLSSASDERLRRAFSGFRHRFTGGDDLAALLRGAREALERWDSLEKCFLDAFRSCGGDTVRALGRFVSAVEEGAGRPLSFLLPHPSRGSALKRLNMFLRWMVRRDEVDPGGWEGVSPAVLLVPVDVHMYRVGRMLGFTSRRTADLRAALEITAGFRRLSPGDPARYDFALTRFGILEGEAGMAKLASLVR